MDSMPAPTTESISALAAASGPDTTGSAAASVGGTPEGGRNRHADRQRAADGSPQTQPGAAFASPLLGYLEVVPPGTVESLQSTDRVALPPPLGSTPKAPGIAPITMVALPPPQGARPARRTGVWVLFPGDTNCTIDCTG